MKIKKKILYIMDNVLNKTYECEICCNDKFNDDDVYICYCKHIYCKKCIITWTKTINVYPKCMNNECNIEYKFEDIIQIWNTNKLLKSIKDHIKKVLYNIQRHKFGKYINDFNTYKYLKSFMDILVKLRSYTNFFNIDIFKYCFNVYNIYENDFIIPNYVQDTLLYDIFNKLNNIGNDIINIIKYEPKNNLNIIKQLNDNKLYRDNRGLNIYVNIMIDVTIFNNNYPNNPTKNILDQLSLMYLLIYCMIVKPSYTKSHSIILNCCDIYDKTLTIKYDKNAKNVQNFDIIQCQNKECDNFLNNKYYCDLCKFYTCNKCKEIYKNKHICDDDIIKTMKLIKNTTSICPVCKIRVNKVSGCNDMFCTNCNNFFCYRTGKLLSGKRHNPEYTDYLNKLRDNDKYDNDECQSMNQIVTRFINNSTSKNKFFYEECVNHIGHIEQYFENNINRLTATDKNVIKISLKYINNETSINKYKTFLMRYKKRIDELYSCKILLDNFVMNLYNKLITVSDDLSYDINDFMYFISCEMYLLNSKFISISKIYKVLPYNIRHNNGFIILKKI